MNQNLAITDQNQLKFCQQTLLEDMQLIIEKAGLQENASTPGFLLGFYDERSEKDNVNLVIIFFKVGCTQLAVIFLKFHLILTNDG